MITSKLESYVIIVVNKSNNKTSGIDDSTMYIFIIRYVSSSEAYIGIHMCITLGFLLPHW